MNKKIILFSLLIVNTALPATFSWKAISEHISQNSAQYGSGLATLIAISTAVYKYFGRNEAIVEKPVVPDERQKFLNMLVKAIESDIFRLDIALKNGNHVVDMRYDAIHVWEKATDKAQEKFSALYSYIYFIKSSVGLPQDARKVKQKLADLKAAIKEEAKKK